MDRWPIERLLDDGGEAAEGIDVQRTVVEDRKAVAPAGVEPAEARP